MNKKIFPLAISVILTGILSQPAEARFEWLKKKANEFGNTGLESLQETKLSDTKIGLGLKDLLKQGITSAVEKTGKKDGYFNNELIKIEMPEKLRIIDRGLRMVGFGAQLDEFILSMNRSAEAAAPKALDIFLDGIFNMNFDDARKIYKGGDTAATNFLKQTTLEDLKKAFRPIVDKSLNQYGVTGQYKNLLKKYKTIPFSKNFNVPEIDEYVIDQAINGLFAILAQEETKIRTNSGSRTTGLLKELFP
ncbi:hypothetical protein MNBD_UNCLBAC01-1848 [hydrothermal vent metagenome]|uniref:DUF4197 domain-containing protein n=1 Tax=hydrothermal vent metagenome TaxID=652676 RepID=A0A3B1D235_9ZZZZ